MNWILGDVHGMYYTLLKLLDKIDQIDDSPVHVFVGDYVDRGGHTPEVLDLVIDLQQDGAVCLRGNHDDVVDWFLNDHTLSDIKELTVSKTPEDAVSWWLQNGFGRTLESYSVATLYPNVIEQFRKDVPKKHKNFLRNLPLYWENETHFACHGFMYPDRELPREFRFMPSDKITNTEVLWSRFSPNPAGGIDPAIIPVWDKIGVFGHTPVSYYGMVAGIKHHNIRLIDTGAFMKEYLTGYCCSRDEFVSVAYDPRDLSL